MRLSASRKHRRDEIDLCFPILYEPNEPDINVVSGYSLLHLMTKTQALNFTLPSTRYETFLGANLIGIMTFQPERNPNQFLRTLSK